MVSLFGPIHQVVGPLIIGKTIPVHLVTNMVLNPSAYYSETILMEILEKVCGMNGHLDTN